MPHSVLIRTLFSTGLLLAQACSLARWRLTTSRQVRHRRTCPTREERRLFWPANGNMKKED